MSLIKVVGCVLALAPISLQAAGAQGYPNRLILACR